MTRKQTFNTITLSSLSENSEIGESAWNLSWPPLNSEEISWLDEVDGGNNPRWRQQIASGQGASTTLFVRAKDWSFTPGYFKYEANIYPDLDPSGNAAKIVRGAIAGWPNPATNAAGVPEGNAVDRAAGQFYRRVRDRMSQFKGATFLAEAAEAKRMIGQRATSMLNLIPGYQDRLRKRWSKTKGKKNKKKLLANSWLELQYGWLPLASDIEDLCKTLKNPVPQFIRVSSDACHTQNVELENIRVEDNGDWQKAIHERHETDYSVRFYGGISARRTPEGSAVHDFGLGVEEFLPTAWEVIPWSFAVDYFTNVSDIITAASYGAAYVGWSSAVYCASRTRTYTGTGQASKFAGSYPLYRVVKSTPSVAKVTAKIIRRDPTATVPIPGLILELPSPIQALNLTALAVSRRLRLTY